MMENNIILFDGVCNLCSGVVKFIIQRDKKKIFQFASLQSEIGQHFLKKFNLSTNDFNSFIFIDNEKHYIKSTAALKVCQKLGRFWYILYLFIIVPPFIRHFFYDIIAQNRYRLFGKTDSCLMPSQELKERFLK